MYEAERKRWVNAIEPVIYALWDAANIFDLVHESVSTASMKRGDSGPISLASICAARFKALAEKEGELLEMLQMALHHAQPPQETKEHPK